MKDRGLNRMNCMKCGREIEETQVFCPECLTEMEKYPVKPGTVVQLPTRSTAAPVRKPARRRPQPNPEEQVKLLKKRVWFLRALLALTMALLITATGFLIWRMNIEDVKILPGQNYRPEETTAPGPQ